MNELPENLAELAHQESEGDLAVHLAVFCNVAPGCRSVRHRPKHESGTSRR